jgi:hypothetical protein
MLGSYFSETECHRREFVSFKGHSEEAEVKSSNFIAALGVGCRCLGKILAILNAVLIIMSNLFEFTGVYQSCFCKSSYIQLRSAAYVSFFSTQVSADIAMFYWISGAGIPMVAIVGIGIGYFELTRDR